MFTFCFIMEVIFFSVQLKNKVNLIKIQNKKVFILNIKKYIFPQFLKQSFEIIHVFLNNRNLKLFKTSDEFEESSKLKKPYTTKTRGSYLHDYVALGSIKNK